MQAKIEITVFIQSKKLWFIRYDKKNITTYMGVVDHSYEDNCNILGCVDLTTVGRHREFRT